MSRSPGVWVLVLFLSFAAIGRAEGSPRAISPAERAACQFVVDYLTAGAAPMTDHVSPQSRFAKLPSAELARELEVRMGPRRGASWQLATVVPSLAESTAVFQVSYPSGLDDTLTMTLDKDGGSYRILDLRVLAEPSLRAAPVPPRPAEGGALSSADWRPALLALLATLLAIAGVAVPRERTVFATSILGCAALMMLAAFWFASKTLRHGPTHDTDVTLAPGTLGDYLDLREWLLSGDMTAKAPPVPMPHEESIRNAILLWTAQASLQRLQLDQVARILDGEWDLTSAPLDHLVRARNAAIRSEESAVAIAYEQAISLGPGRDVLWEEAAEQLSTAGFEERSRRYLEQSVRNGSRDPTVYYWLASVRAGKGDLAGAARLLPTAWALQPIERERLMAMPSMWSVLRIPPVSALVSLSASEEPLVRDASLGSAPLKTPPKVAAYVCGALLRIESGDAEVTIPGGASIAPANAVVMNAAQWAAHDDEKALADAPALEAIPNKTGAMTQPLLRARFVAAASTLTERNRWTEVLKLTESISPDTENVPTDLMFARGTALRRSGSPEEARLLFIALARSPSVKRRGDARELWQLGENFALLGDYGTAIRFMEKAASKREIPFLDDRVRQLLTNQRLANGYQSQLTQHFDIHSPQGSNATMIGQIANVLESERARLQEMIPATQAKRITVNVVPWEEFRSIYTGSDYILGFYDGKLTLPIAGVTSLTPHVVSVMTHELAHALIAEATADRAPRWFHEGLAQRVQEEQVTPDALQSYASGQLYSVSLLDAVLSNSPDPDSITEAYVESESVVRFIETSCGRHAINSFLVAFGGGATTADAIHSVCGMDMQSFDAAFRAWGAKR